MCSRHKNPNSVKERLPSERGFRSGPLCRTAACTNIMPPGRKVVDGGVPENTCRFTYACIFDAGKRRTKCSCEGTEGRGQGGMSQRCFGLVKRAWNQQPCSSLAPASFAGRRLFWSGGRIPKLRQQVENSAGEELGSFLLPGKRGMFALFQRIVAKAPCAGCWSSTLKQL